MKYFVKETENKCALLIDYIDVDNFIWTLGSDFLSIFKATHFDFENNSISFYSDDILIEKLNPDGSKAIKTDIRPINDLILVYIINSVLLGVSITLLIIIRLIICYCIKE